MKRNLKKKNNGFSMVTARSYNNQKPILTYAEFIQSYNIKEKQKKLVKGWFPLYPSTELAGITAALITDGHIDWKSYDRYPRPQKLVLYSNDESECMWFLRKVHKISDVNGKIVKYKSATGFSKNESFKAIVYCAPLARILVKLGVPCGDKTKKAYAVPVWIKHGSKKIKQSFLRVLFNFDGSISLRSRREAVEINYTMNKQNYYIKSGEEFLDAIKDLLNEFGINSGKIHIRHCKDDKYTLMFFLSSFKSIINFYRFISFLSHKKNKKLKQAMDRIYRKARVQSAIVNHSLSRLKEQTGSDRKTVTELNKISKLKYSYRQFEHMRRGESWVPIDLVWSVSTLLRINCASLLPEHFEWLINFIHSRHR